jgi:hypothetical protein
MKTLTLAMWLCFNALPVLAAPIASTRAAPAPLIGLGLPVALAVGGAILGAKLLKRRR